MVRKTYHIPTLARSTRFLGHLMVYQSMAKKRTKAALPASLDLPPGYDEVLTGISELISRARHGASQAVNSFLTVSYWEVGRRIIELEQRGQARAAYGEGLWKRLAADLTARHGRGFSKSNLA